MLFKVIPQEDVFKTNPELESIEELSRCTDRQLRYIIFTYDYKSPLRALKLDTRKEKAALLAGYKLEKSGKRLDTNGRSAINGGNQRIEKAITVFKSLQRDEDRETLAAVESHIEEIKSFSSQEGKSANDLKKAGELLRSLPGLLELKKEVASILEIRDEAPTEDEEIVQDKDLSTLDILNQKL